MSNENKDLNTENIEVAAENAENTQKNENGFKKFCHNFKIGLLKFLGKSTEKSSVDVKIEKVSLIKSLNVFKGLKLPWILLAIALVCAIANAIITFEVISFSAKMIDSSGNLPTEQFVRYILATLLTGGLLIGNSLASNFAAKKINHMLRCKLFDKIMKLRQAELGPDAGEELVSRVTLDTEYASQYFVQIIAILTQLVKGIYYIVGMYQLNVTMANYAMIYIPVTILCGLLISYLQYRVTLKKQGFLALSTSYLVERTKDLMLIKTCNSQQKEIKQGNQYFDQQYTVQVRTSFVQFFADIIEKIFTLAATVIPFLVGAYLFSKGEISVGTVIIFGTIINDTKMAFTAMLNGVSLLKQANGGSAKISKIFDFNDEILNVGAEASATVENIAFENVTFGYVEGKTILNDVSFVIPKNKVTAILGKNGSGKTTSFNLIERLYDVGGGAVRYGDDNIADYSLSSWRDKTCLVAQGGALMTGTLRSNICYGRDDVSDEEFEKAVTLSHVSDFAKDLPLGYDSPVAMDGSNYSGGQRQCIAIARAMLSQKPILLLDEATCNLDAKRESDVMNALENLIKDRTTILIAHSLGTVKHANHIIVLNNGKVETTGTPADIMKQTDNYLAKMMTRATA